MEQTDFAESFLSFLRERGQLRTEGVMTREELIAQNKAYNLPISIRSGLSEAFHYLENPTRQGSIRGMILLHSGEWTFEGDTATRKSDGFTITRDEIDSTEVWT